ncbi:hypothetical protein, partial [Enterobacter kobei]
YAALFCHRLLLSFSGAFDVNTQGPIETTRYASYHRNKTNHASRFAFPHSYRLQPLLLTG